MLEIWRKQFDPIFSSPPDWFTTLHAVFAQARNRAPGYVVNPRGNFLRGNVFEIDDAARLN